MSRSSLKKRIGRARDEQRALTRERQVIAKQGTESARAAVLKVARLEDVDGDRRAHHLAMTAALALTDLHEYQEKRS